MKGTQEGFLSRAISPPHPKGISSPLTRLRHSDKFRPLAEICPRHIQKPYGFWICRGQISAKGRNLSLCLSRVSGEEIPLGCGGLIARERNPSWVPFTLSSLPPTQLCWHSDRLRKGENQGGLP